MFEILLHALLAKAFRVEVTALDGHADRGSADAAMTAENQRRMNGFAGDGGLFRLARIDEGVFDDVSVFEQYHPRFRRRRLSPVVRVRRSEVADAAGEGLYQGGLIMGRVLGWRVGGVRRLGEFSLVRGRVGIHDPLSQGKVIQ